MYLSLKVPFLPYDNSTKLSKETWPCLMLLFKKHITYETILTSLLGSLVSSENGNTVSTAQYHRKVVMSAMNSFA